MSADQFYVLKYWKDFCSRLYSRAQTGIMSNDERTLSKNTDIWSNTIHTPVNYVELNQCKSGIIRYNA
jgi:hypothetical protein